MRLKKTLLWLAAVSLVSSTTNSLAQSDEFELERKPVWEVGLAGAYFSGVDYPGSSDPNSFQAVLPFFIYRSKLFRVGDGGVGAIAVEEPRLKVDVSFGGSLNAESETDSVRAGMPDLDLLFEFGPRVQYKLYKHIGSNGSETEITLDGKLRAVIGTDFESIRAQGFIVGSGIDLVQRAVVGSPLDFIISADITFADQRYHDNLYSVPSEFATANREAYTAKPGYVETSTFLGFAFQATANLRLFTGVVLGSQTNSANERSPLFETDSSTQYAAGVVWTAYRSKRTIDVYTSD